MSLNLRDVLKKAKDKGIISNNQQTSSQTIRPWQQESTLFSSKNDTKTTIDEQQTDNKAATNRQQADNKAATNRQQKKEKKEQTGNKVATQPTTLSATKWQQSGNKPTTNHSFSSLVGLQRILVIFIYNECKIARSKSTENLTLEYIGKAINSSPGCVKTTLQRLEAKEFIKRIDFKNGRGGWSKYSISDKHFQEILQHETDNKPTTKWQQSDNKVVTQPTTQPTTSPLSSSSFNNYIKTTTGDEESSAYSTLSTEWQNIDIESLSEIGFTITHLSQIASQNKLPPQTVQDSIHAFAFDLEKNDKAKKIKGSALNYFMGILRNGMPYALPQNYESPQDRAMRLYLERVREIEQKRLGNEKEAMELAFNDWFKQLSDAQKREYVPNVMRHAKTDGMLVLQGAKGYFEKEIWPEKRTEIMGKTMNFEREEAENQKLIDFLSN